MWGSGFQQRQRQNKMRTAGLAGKGLQQLQAAPHLFGQCPRDRKAKPGAKAGTRAAHKRLEHGLRLVGGNAGAGICHFDAQRLRTMLCRRLPHGNSNPTANSIFNGV